MRWGPLVRLPAWQFTDGGVLPGLDRALAVIPEGIDPVGVWEWFVHPDPSLLNLWPGEVDCDVVSVRDWLRLGGEVEEAVVRTARAGWSSAHRYPQDGCLGGGDLPTGLSRPGAKDPAIVATVTLQRGRL